MPVLGLCLDLANMTTFPISMKSSSGCQFAFVGTHIVSLLYNVLLKAICPSYLKIRSEFLDATQSSVLSSSENIILKILKHSYESYSKSFAVQTALLWNALPVTIRKAQSLNSFKSLFTAITLASRTLFLSHYSYAFVILPIFLFSYIFLYIFL
jgi:hypothetical protein